MVQEADKIRHHIESERRGLEQSVDEMEHRFKRALDWRAWFDKNPLSALGIAAAGGFALSMLASRSSEYRMGRDESDFSTSPTRPGRSRSLNRSSFQINRVADTLDNTVAALLGVASHKFQDFIADIVPNFREEYREAESRGFHGSSTNRMESSRFTSD